MKNIYNKETDKWIRPWNLEKFDELKFRDERFFSILIKGCLNWLNLNIILYDKPINHFIFTTGSSIMYVESNGYELNWQETTGEDQMYNKMPRCVCEIGEINIPMEELTNPYTRGTYERKSSLDGNYKGYNAEIQRVPIELSMTLRYVLSNFNESIILIQELIEKLLFQKYFNIIYLGQKIQCSIEFPSSNTIQTNKIDFDSPEVKQKTIEIGIKIDSYLPVVNVKSEIQNNQIIKEFEYNTKILDSKDNLLDTAKDLFN